MTEQTISLPLVTVIMPVRNEQAFIARSLGAVLAQDYPHDRLEVLVADGMSTDRTREIIADLAAHHPDIALHVVDNPGYIVPAGMNRATAQARGTIIVRVDGHCEIAPDYVRHCVRHLQATNVDAVGGPITTVGQTPLGEAIAAAMSTPFGVGGSSFRTEKERTLAVDTVAFPAYTRHVIEMAGPYDESMQCNEDDEYNYRLGKLGFRIWLASDIRSRYYSRASLRGLWRQYFRYGVWKVPILQKHPAQMRPRQFVPPAFVAALIGSLLLALPFRFGRTLLTLIGGTYALANLAASLKTASEAGWEKLRYLPPVFAALHLSYGAGFLAGLWRFRTGWNAPPEAPTAAPQPEQPDPVERGS